LNNEPSASTLERIQGRIDALANESAAGNFATQSEIMAQYRKKLDKPYFDKLFVAVDANGKEIASNDMTTPVAYIKAKYHFAVVGDITSFVNDADLDLPSIYDGLPIDGQTLKWKEVTNEDGSVTRVLESVGSGGTADKVTWANIEGKPTWIGESKPSYSWTEITGKPSWIGSSKPSYSWTEIKGRPSLDFLPLTGGTLTGDLRLKDSSNYGMTLYFGDGSYCYISEPSDDKMTIHASNGVTIETGNSYYVEVNSKGIKVNGGIIKYNGSYWEIEGDVLVNGDITSII
jgi:hypothetical protein